MRYISEKEYKSCLKRIQAENKSKERLQKLKEEKNKFGLKLRLPATSKLILLGAVLLCLEIVIFGEYVMLTRYDTSAMYALIGIPVTLTPIIWGYYSKSKAENTQGGITYDMAMAQIEAERELAEQMTTQSEADGLNSDNAVG